MEAQFWWGFGTALLMVVAIYFIYLRISVGSVSEGVAAAWVNLTDAVRRVK